MKKKALLFTGIAFVFVMLAVGAVFAEKANKLKGAYKFWDGIINSEKDLAAKKEISDSIDPVTGKATKEFKPNALKPNNDGSIQVVDSQKEQIVNFDFDGKKAKLKLHVVSKGNKNIVLPNSEEGYQLTQIPNKNAYVLEYNGSLYELNAADGTISKLLSDNVAGYDMVSLKAKQVEDLSLVWGEKSRVSPSGDYLLFYSNRSAVKSGFGDGELWMKNLNTNYEEAVYSGPFEYVGWGQNDNVFIRNQDKIYEINLNDKTSTLIDENVSLETTVVYPYLVQPVVGKITITDMATRASVSLTEGIGRTDMILGSGSHFIRQ